MFGPAKGRHDGFFMMDVGDQHQGVGLYHGLGLGPDLEIHDRLNRPMLLLPEGAPIRDLFS